jgi:hypothetical protein
MSGSSKKSLLPNDAVDVLRVLAARLGDDWAASVFESTSEDESWSEYEAQVLPWKEYLRTMRAAIYWIRRDYDGEDTPTAKVASEYFMYFQKIEALGSVFQFTESKARTTVLAFALGAWTELDKADIDVDMDRLIDYVCGPHWTDATQDCQDSISELNKTFASTDQHYWHRLSQFKSRSIELGLFNLEPHSHNPG